LWEKHRARILSKNKQKITYAKFFRLCAALGLPPDCSVAHAGVRVRKKKLPAAWSNLVLTSWRPRD